MEIYERIRYLRKDKLKLSQEKFGEILGVNRSGINNIEGNRLVKPEQKEPLYRLICKTFNVNYEWLTTGQGDMYVITKQSFLEKLSAEYGLSLYAQKIIECYLNLDDEQRGAVDYFIKSLAESIAPVENDDTEQLTVVDEAIDKIEILKAAKSKDNAPPQSTVDSTIEKVEIWRAARSENNAPPKKVEISAERIKELDENPEIEEI